MDARQIDSITGSFTNLSKVVVCVLVAGYAVAKLVPTSADFLALSCGRVFVRLWTLITQGFFVTKILELLADIMGALLLLRLVEPSYGTLETCRLLLAVNVGLGFLLAAGTYALFVATQDVELIYDRISGFQGIMAALVVAVKHIMPDGTVGLGTLIIPQVRVQHLPALYVLLSTPIALLLGDMHQVAYVLGGTCLAWCYIRYVQKLPGAEVRGEPSSDFSALSFLSVAPLSRPSIKLNAATLPVSSPLPTAGLPGREGEALQAARRRERGARALEARLARGGGRDGGLPSAHVPPGVQSTAAAALGLNGDDDTEAGQV